MNTRCSAVSLALLAIAAPALAQPISQPVPPTVPPIPPQRRVLVIGVDGLKPSTIPAANTPALDALIANGTYNDNAQGEDLTFSGPNWSTILHGVHRDKHGVINNGYDPSNLDNHPDLLAHVEHAHPSWTTARLSTWDMLHERQPTGADINLFWNYEDGGDDDVAAITAQIILGEHPDAPDGPRAIFAYLGNVDIAGHTHGYHLSAPGYLEGVETADAQIGLMTAAIAQREANHNEAWLVILTSDHGGNIDKGHAGNTLDRRTVPFIVSGKLAAKGTAVPEPKNVDTVATALAYLSVEPMAPIDGHAVGLERHASPAANFNTNLIVNPGGEHDRGFSDPTFDQAIAGWIDPGPGMMNLLTYGTEGGWPSETTPGPIEKDGVGDVGGRGNNFFTGGTAPISEITQEIDLSSLSGRIGRGRVSFTLSGWFGGFGIQDDSAELRVEFFSPEGFIIGAFGVDPVTAEDREFETKLMYREYVGPTPRRAVRARVILRSTKRAGEYSDGYADNLGLVINAR